MSHDQNDLDLLALRAFPKTTYNERLSQSERLEIIIHNLEEAQKDVKTEILTQALIDKDELDKQDPETLADLASPQNITQPNLRMMRARYRSNMPKPPDARMLKSEPASLFLEQQSHGSVTRETVAKLDEYAKGTPTSLAKFYAAREVMAKDAGRGAGSGGAGPPAVVTPGTAGGSAQPVVNDVNRDPRLRR